MPRPAPVTRATGRVIASCFQKRDQLADPPSKELLAFGGVRSSRIAEHPVRGDRPHAADAQLINEVPKGRSRADLGPIEADSIRINREHHRRFGSPRMGITARMGRVPDADRSPLGFTHSGRCLHRFSVPAVAVDQHHTIELRASRPHNLDDRRREHLPADRQCPGKAGVLPGCTDRERRRNDRASTAAAARSATVTAMVVSVSSGRWGPCCRSNPAEPRARASTHLRRCQIRETNHVSDRRTDIVRG